MNSSNTSALQTMQPQGTALQSQQMVPPFAPVQLGLSEESKLALLEYWRSITKRKWPILGLACVFAVLAAAVAFAMTPIYRSTVTVLVEQGRGKLLSIEDLFSSGGMQSREHYQTQVEILKSREVALHASRAMKLWQQPDFDPRLADESISERLGGLVGVKQPAVQWTDDKLAESAAKHVMREMAVEPVRLSQLVKVSYESPDKELAARVANQLATSYIDNDRESRLKLNQSLNGWLEQRAVELRAKLTQAEAALQKYREQQGLVNLSGSAQALAGKQVTDMSQQLIEARSRRVQLETAYQIASGITNGDYSGVPVVVNHSSVQIALQREAEAANKVAELSESMGPANTKLIEAQTALAAAREYRKRQTAAVVQSLTQEYNQAVRTERSLEGAVRAASGGVQDVNRKEFQLTVLEREVASNKELYEQFMSRAREMKAGGDVEMAVARIVDPAVAASAPVRPNKMQMVVVAFVLGLFVGAMGALLLDRLDNTIKGGESAEAKLQQPVLTVLPDVGEAVQNQAMATMILKEPSSHHAEAIRTARTGVLLSYVDEPNRVLVVTSSMPGEGKTSLSANLGLALAPTKRTLLIEADMRRPQLASRLNLPQGAKGLSNLVTGTATLKECVHHVADSPLLVMPAGDIPPNPLELLLSQRFKDMVKHLQSQLDFILIDTPPVELVSDAMVVAPLATGTIYVVRAMKTPYPMARKGISRLTRTGARMLGVVVNGLNFDKAQRYYGETVAGGYGTYYQYAVDKPKA